MCVSVGYHANCFTICSRIQDKVPYNVGFFDFDSQISLKRLYSKEDMVLFAYHGEP